MTETSWERQLTSPTFATLIESVGRATDLRAARTVVVKPNLTSRVSDPARHITTDPQLLRDVIGGLLAASPQASVLIAESDSRGHVFAYTKFEQHGLPERLGLSDDDRERVALLDLSRDRLVQVTRNDLRFFNSRRSLWLSETLVAADVVVSLANCKTHNLAGYTGACKNLFGCLPQMDKTLYHSRLHDVVHDVNLAISPQLGIVDGFAAMGGNGPISGQARDLGFRVFSRSAIGADMVASQLAGMDPSRIPHLRQLAATLGVEVNLGEDPPLNGSLDPLGRYDSTVRSIAVGVQGFGYSVVSLGQRMEDARDPAAIVRGLGGRALRRVKRSVRRFLP